jgi:hypothetical protein
MTDDLRVPRLLNGHESRWPRRALVFALASFGLGLSWSNERGSVERANRLHREGRTGDAAALYRARAEQEDARPRVLYNLGTALIGLENAAGEDELSAAMASREVEVHARSQYNIGVSRLTRALDVAEGDSTRIHAEASVAATTHALRLRPEDADAQWNLAIGLRLLDSIDATERRSGREMADGAAEAVVVVRSENIPDAEEDERAQDPPMEGENEALAEASDEPPLSLEEAEEILGTTHLDATQILTKMLAMESRSRGGRRVGSAVRR